MSPNNNSIGNNDGVKQRITGSAVATSSSSSSIKPGRLQQSPSHQQQHQQQRKSFLFGGSSSYDRHQQQHDLQLQQLRRYSYTAVLALVVLIMGLFYFFYFQSITSSTGQHSYLYSTGTPLLTSSSLLLLTNQQEPSHPDGFLPVQSVYELSDHHSTKHQRVSTTSSGSSKSNSNTGSISDQIHNITTAVCYKALFGSELDIGLILQWIAYHHLLGFDHFFFFYRTEVTILPNWNILVNNPVVTMIHWADNIGTRASYYDQASGTEVQCLTVHAKDYDWVFIADIDEYLYLGNKNRYHDLVKIESASSPSSLPSPHNTAINETENGYILTDLTPNDYETQYNPNDILTIKELLYLYRNMTYLSFGKRMYSLDHRIDIPTTDINVHAIDNNDRDTNNNLIIRNYQLNTVLSNERTETKSLRDDPTFALSSYPYYMDQYFCNFRNFRRGDPICPLWRGRCKVIVRPTHHTFIDVHGRYPKPLLPSIDRTIHFHPDLYHIKEWPHLLSYHNITIHSSTSSPATYYNFTIYHEEEVHIHNIHTGYLPFQKDPITNKEMFLVKQDTQLREHFQAIINQAIASSNVPIRLVSKDDHKE